jgi:hypothetical protein
MDAAANYDYVESCMFLFTFLISSFSVHFLLQRHPCRVTALEIFLSTLSGALFISDIVSDILVLSQLQAAGPDASAALAFGIIFM